MNEQQRAVACIRSSTEHIAALIQERDELQKQVWRYEKHGVTCQTYGNKVESTCSECNVHENYTSHNNVDGLCPATKPNGVCGCYQKGFTDGMNEFLLYETTPPAQPAVPLTDEQANLFINGRGEESDDDYVEPTGDGFGLTDEDLVKLIRRVEAHHGIGVKP
jgi:hypothetical protein